MKDVKLLNGMGKRFLFSYGSKNRPAVGWKTTMVVTTMSFGKRNQNQKKLEEDNTIYMGDTILEKYEERKAELRRVNN